MNWVEKNINLAIPGFAILVLGLSGQFIDVSIMEARNFITAREMVDDGNWLLTTLNGEARYQKPPLPTWLTAMMYSIFGDKTFALRLPTILMAGVLAITVKNFSLKIGLSDRHSALNGLITISSFYILGIVLEAPWDIYTHGFMMIGIYHLYSLFKASEKYWRHSLLAGLFIGLSIMSKGPISVYALLLPFLIAYPLTLKYKTANAKVFSGFSVIIIAVLMGGWWYFYVRYMDPESFNAIANTETSNWASYNVRPFYYYWSFFAQSGIWTIPAFVGLIYPYLKNKVVNRKLYKFTLLWTLVAVILLSIIPEKKSRYLMPVLIPLALNTGFYVEYLVRSFKEFKNEERWFLYLNFGLIGLFGFVTPVFFFLSSANAEYRWISFIVIGTSSIYVGYRIIKNLVSKDILNVIYLLFPLLIITAASGSYSLALTSNPEYSPILGLKEETSKKSLEIYSLGTLTPELLWQYGGTIQEISKDELNDKSFDQENFGLIMPPDTLFLNKMNSEYKIRLLGKFDINRSPEWERGYKDRLRRDAYEFLSR